MSGRQERRKRKVLPIRLYGKVQFSSILRRMGASVESSSRLAVDV